MSEHGSTESLVSPARNSLRVRGTVQGVGFRPSVYRLARARNLAGFVRNDSEGVWIEIEGPPEVLAHFPDLLRRESPPLARIHDIEVAELSTLGETGFRVVANASDRSARAIIPADSAPCRACLDELFDPSNRRYRYPFINCTDCGPRYTIVRDVPYDRSRTTMDAFALCERCRQEYEDPGDRRFHAEPNACPACGPRLEFTAADTSSLFGAAALDAAIEALRGGEIVAVKGLGGFHLAADAANCQAVGLLRFRKHRASKPFALMVRDLETAREVVEIRAVDARVLESRARPIVLLARKSATVLSSAIAPGLSEIGIMLPYTPLHNLLVREGPPMLVMTSGNRSEEPIARDNAEAVDKLAGIADGFLFHDRGIHSRADDSVMRIVSGQPQPVRRSRGLVPEPIELPFDSPAVLAVGGELKNTVCLTRGNEAYVSPHIGDLGNPEARRFFEEAIGTLTRLLDTKPAAIAHDLHPDYFTTRWARSSGLDLQAVQHHHAHIASCLAEHGRTAPAIGIAFDGTGCGPEGELWGGEILVAGLASFRRLGHLRPLRLAGGEAAIRQPWRVAAAALLDAGEDLDLLPGIDARRAGEVRRLLESKFRSPTATGAGRWFDAVAALCGFSGEVTYEGQAAAELEASACRTDVEPYSFGFDSSGAEATFEVDLRPLVRGIARDLRAATGVSTISARFHETLAFAVLESARRSRQLTEISTVALSGGCFQNKLLTERTKGLLESDGFDVLVQRRVPPNDGGLSLGQAAVAGFRLRSRMEGS